MADQSVRLSMETLGLTEADQFIEKLNKCGVSVKGFSQILTQFDKHGQIVETRLKLLTERLEQIDARIGKRGKVLGFKLIDSGQEEREAEKVLQVQLRNASRLLRELNRNKLAAEKEATKIIEREEQERIRTAKRLLNELNRNKLTAEKEAKRLLEREEEDRIKTAKRLLNAQVKEKLSAEKLAAKQANEYMAALSKENILKNTPQFKTLNIDSQIRALSALNSAISGIQTGKLDPKRFEQMFNAIKNNQPFTALTREEQRAEMGLRRFLNTLDQFERSSKNGGQGLLLTFQQIVRILQVQVLHRVFSAIINGITEGIKRSQEFQIGISRIRTISQDASASTAEWSDELIKLSNNFNVELLDATAAAYNLISNQIAKGTDAVITLGHAFQFAKVTGATAKDSVDLLSFAINAFKLNANEAQKIYGLMFKTIDLGNTTAQELAQNFGTTAAFAAQAGISLKEFLLGVTTLTIQGIQTETAMTLMRNVMKELVKPTEEMSALFREWGVTSGESALKAFGLIGVLQKLQKELQGGGTERLGTLVDDLRGLVGVIGLAGGANLEVYRNAANEFQNAAKTYKNALETIQESPAFKIESTMNEIKNSFIEFGDSILNGMTLVAGFRKEIDEFGNVKISSDLLDIVQGLLGPFQAVAGFASAINSYLSTIDTGPLKEVLAVFDKIGRFPVLRLLSRLYEAGSVAKEAGANYLAQFKRAKELDELEKTRKDPVIKAKREEADKNINIEQKRIDRIVNANKTIMANYDNFYKTITGMDEVNLEKFKEKVDKMIEKSKELKEKIVDSFGERAFARNLDTKTNIFDKVQVSMERIVNLRTEAFDFFNNENIEGARDRFGDIVKIVEKINDDMQKLINEQIKGLQDLGKKTEERAFERTLRGAGTGKQKTLYKERIEDLRQRALREKDPDKSLDFIKDAEKLAEKLNDVDENAYKKANKDGKGKKKLAGDPFLDQIAKDEETIRKRIIEQAKAKQVNEETIANIRLKMEDLFIQKQKEKVAVIEAFKNATDAEIKANEAAVAAIRNKIKAIEDYKESLTSLTGGVSINGKRVGGDSTASDFSGTGFAGARFASGGMIHGPMGRDNLIIRAHAGEFIVNSEATKAFYPQLVALNAGLPPRGFANGGPVTNVGDLNINMTSQGSVEADVRELGYRLRREIKRGTVRLT